jgi:hypothetical protein
VKYTAPSAGSPDLNEAFANAELIVRAVNAFEPLLEKLSVDAMTFRLLAKQDRIDGMTDRATQLETRASEIDALLAKARGEQ